MFQTIRIAIHYFLELIVVLIILDAISSWFMKKRGNGFSRIIGIIVDPILEPCYKLQSKLFPGSPVDFSPIIAIILIQFIQRFI